MGLINKLLEKRSSATDEKFEAWMRGEGGWLRVPTQAGVPVSEHSALQLSTVYACVRLIAWTLASLPLPVYRRLTPKGKERTQEHPLYSLLHDQPNTEQTSFEWRSLTSVHQNLWGYGISEIEFKNGIPVALWPLPPWMAKIMRTEKGTLFYRLNLLGGGHTNLRARQVLYMPALGTSREKPLSPIGLHRETIGYAMALREFGAKTFGQGVNPTGVLSTEGYLKEDTRKAQIEEVQKQYAGLSKAHRIMLLEGGLKFDRIGLPPEDAQYIQSQKFTIADIARIYNVPLHLLQEHDSSTTWGSGIEELNLGFVTFTLRPYLVQWEQEFKRRLFDGDKEHFAEFLVDGLLRGNTQSRNQAYAIGRQWGWLSADDVRELENQNPLPDGQGETYLVPMNMIPAALAAGGQTPPSPDVDDEDERIKKFKEERAKRSAARRFNIAKSFEAVVADAARRVLKREEADVIRKARKVFNERDANQALLFNEWLNEFYEEHREFVKQNMLPAFVSLAGAIQSEAGAEVNLEDEIDVTMQQFLDEYGEAYSVRHIRSQRARLQQIINRATEEELDYEEALQDQFDDWVENKPGQIALDETVQLAGAVALTTYAAAGIRRKRWVAVGPDPCPLCEEMDGRVVGIEGTFLAANEQLDPDDPDTQPIQINRDTRHPPLHGGCVCQISPE